MQSYPKAIGPYSAFKKAGDLLFVSGQIPLDPATNGKFQLERKNKAFRIFIIIFSNIIISPTANFNLFDTKITKFHKIFHFMQRFT